MRKSRDFMLISFYQGPRTLSRKVHTTHDFFMGDVIVKEYEDRFVFTKPTIDYGGKTSHFSTTPVAYQGFLTSTVPPGTYRISEEDSDEDTIVVYFKDKV